MTLSITKKFADVHEGVVLDIWSIPHFLSGMALALLWQRHVAGGILLACLLAFGYELLEPVIWWDLRETGWNFLADILLAGLGAVFTYLVLWLC
jgi:hypothetical protein